MVNFYGMMQYAKVVKLKKQDTVFAVYTASAEYGHGEL